MVCGYASQRMGFVATTSRTCIQNGQVSDRPPRVVSLWDNDGGWDGPPLPQPG